MRCASGSNGTERQAGARLILAAVAGDQDGRLIAFDGDDRGGEPDLDRRQRGVWGVHHVPWRGRSLQIEPERIALERRDAAADRLDRRGHAAAAAEQAVGERDDADVGRRGRRGAAQPARDRRLVAARIERAGRDEGAGGRAADAGIAMHHQRRRAVPAAHEVEEPGDMLVGRARRSRRAAR